LNHKILIVDDEYTLRHFLGLSLAEQGYQVLEANDGASALELIARHNFAVALVDLKLTDMNGLDIMRHLRQHSPETSVIILTAYASVNSAIEALRQGAHDYRTKPYEPAELLASVADGIARRQVAAPPPASPTGPEAEILRAGGIEVNRGARQVTINHTPVNLTPTEYDILVTLMMQMDVAVDAITLVKAVRGYEATEADARAIARVHVHRLRHKLEPDPAQPRYITTVAGGRYLFRSA
jgi:two-component system KDP operon response regulator KdpE